MEILAIIIFLILTALIIAVVFLLNKGQSQTAKNVNERLNWITQQVTERLRDNSQSLQNASLELGSKLESAVKVVTDVHKHLGRLEAHLLWWCVLSCGRHAHLSLKLPPGERIRHLKGHWRG